MKKINYYDNKNVISRRLHYFRKLRGLSQEQLVARLQVMNVNRASAKLSTTPGLSRITSWPASAGPLA